MMLRWSRTVCLIGIASSFLLLGGCSGTAVQGTSGSKSSEKGPAPVTLPGEERVAEEIQIAKAEPAEVARQRAREQQMAQEAAATASSGLHDVYFGFDSWKIRDEDKSALAADAQWLKSNDAKKITIEGHCDERGTQAYNLVLGEKRAKAVRSYLSDMGVDSKRLVIASYGKDRPFCKGQTEECYQQNRRGHLVLRAK